MRDEWTQVDGDVAASEGGATFGQLDTIGERIYGVHLVEVINMVDACGSDWDVQQENGEYVTESHYVDVNGIDWRTARAILDSYGWPPRPQDMRRVPYSVAKRLVYIRQHARDLAALAQWECREPSESEVRELATLDSEAETLRQWYSTPHMQRAIMAASYGGYSEGQSMTFRTLADAMDYHGIPASALYRPTEYDARPNSMLEAEWEAGKNERIAWWRGMAARMLRWYRAQVLIQPNEALQAYRVYLAVKGNYRDEDTGYSYLVELDDRVAAHLAEDASLPWQVLKIELDKVRDLLTYPSK